MGKVSVACVPSEFIYAETNAVKVPAITYGPPHPIDQPAPSSIKLNESLIIVEFIADLYPHASFLPKDPVQKAKARVFAASLDSVLLPAMRQALFSGTEGIAEIYKALDFIQAQLPDGTKYAIGNDFTIADIAAAPLFAILEVVFSNDIGMYEPGEGLKVYEAYKSAKYDKLRGYVKRILEQESVKKVVDTVSQSGLGSVPSVSPNF